MASETAQPSIGGPPSGDPRQTLRHALWQKSCVMHAVLLRDIRSRFFDHGLGFLIVPFFPIAHMGVLLVIYTVMNRPAPFGDDLRLFFGTGLMPIMIFMYVSRFMSVSLLANKTMMAFPVVKLLDIVLARAALELVGMLLAVGIMCLILISVGTNPMPVDVTQALLALLTSSALAIGMGICASVICAMAPFFAIIYSLAMVIFYLTSGAPIYVHIFPEIVVYICSWNPVFHAVEWMRSAYYIGYPTQALDMNYLLGWTIGSLVIGLGMERTFRRQMLHN
jgi:capsular polysaccharide transport system permease protein